jgi:hypothetical protein
MIAVFAELRVDFSGLAYSFEMKMIGKLLEAR